MSRATHSAPWTRVLKFAALPLISIISSLAIIPAVAHSLGASAWAALALGQALGVTASIIVNFGWSVVGPSHVAPALNPARFEMLSHSIWFRLVLCLPTWTIITILAIVLAPPQYAGLSAGMAVAVSSFGLSNSWYFVGTGQPGKIALFDTAPKVIVAALSIYPIIQWGNAFIYPALLFGVSIVSVGASFKSATGRWLLHRAPIRHVIRTTIRTQGPLTVSSLIASGYTSFSIPITSVVRSTTDIVAPFAGAQRLLNAGQGGLMSVTSALQGWIGEQTPNDVRANRIKNAVIVTLLAGLLGGISLALALPLLDKVIFGPEVTISKLTGLFTGLGFIAYTASAALSYYVLIPLSKLRIISIATIIASVSGVPLLYLLAKMYGVEGASLAVAIAELIVMAIELPYCVMMIRKREHTRMQTFDPDSDSEYISDTYMGERTARSQSS